MLLISISFAACAAMRAPAAPTGQVVTAQAGVVELADLWAERDLVVVFYRGFW